MLAPARPRRGPAPLRLARLAPTLAAAALAGAYVVVSPPSPDLAAQLFRAHLFATEGFSLWDNWWYSGHDLVGYSVLFGAVAAQLTPQLAAAAAAVGTAALFEALVHERFGADAWLGALLLGAATATDLYSGRLTFAFGALPALGAVFALHRGRWAIACAGAGLAALSSPVAALFCALAAVGCGLGGYLERRSLGAALRPGAVAVAALVPVALIAVVFGEGGSEPFALSTLWPIVVIVAVALVTLPREMVTVRATVAVYGAATIAAYLIPSAVGSNIVRLGTLLAAPLAALVWWRRRTALLWLAAPALLYLQWQAPVADVSTTAADPSSSIAYYRPLLAFLDQAARPPAPPFRTEISFTRSHWEAYVVAMNFPLARGWERQLDLADNPIFYRGRLTATVYRRWLHASAVRFVAVPDAAPDYSATAEVGLISRGLAYLHLVMRSAHWRVYAVADPTPIVTGLATLQAIGPDWLALHARAPGSVLVRVRFSPYWALARGPGCVAAAGAYTRVTLPRAGAVRLVMAFSVSRIAATSPRCRQ